MKAVNLSLMKDEAWLNWVICTVAEAWWGDMLAKQSSSSSSEPVTEFESSGIKMGRW